VLVANELADHRLQWHGDRIDKRMCKISTASLSLYSLRYGAEVGIFPDLYDDFSLVHFSLSGEIEVEADRHRSHVPFGRALVSTPRENINLRWSQGSEQLILRVPHDLLEAAARDIGDPDRYKAVAQMPGLVMSEQASHLWQAQLRAFAALEAGGQRSSAFGPWFSHVERGMALFLLLQSTQTVDMADLDRPANWQRRDKSVARRLDRLRAYADANLQRPVTLGDLASVAALSERQLNAFCHAEMGQAPMTWLRGVRLDAIRMSLIANPDLDLSDIAMLHGFFHLGRFSAYYRERFGELPSQTRKIARNG
jgi:AraC-like DNA-binding protein